MLQSAAMTRRTLFLVSALALAAGCDKGCGCDNKTAGPATSAMPATTTTAGASATATTTVSTASSADEPPPAPPTVWSFDSDKTDEPPAGFEVFKAGGKAGKWVAKAVPGAPSGPNVLAQLDTEKSDRFTGVVAGDPLFKDVRVSVRLKPVSGKGEQSCGVVVRYKDDKNYYLARASATDKDVNLYVVRNGKRGSLAGWKGATFGEAWHELRLEAKGDHLNVIWDGTAVCEANDKTLPEAGKVGVWVKGDSVSYFDQLTAQPL